MELKKYQPLFTILHFNDVYDIQPTKKGQCGIVNFQAYIRKLKVKYPRSMVLFSGDCFSPSILSNIYEGKQMVSSLNKLGIDVACYGNHEFDFHPQITQALVLECNFPFLLGNIKYKDSDFCLGNGIPYVVKEFYGVKIGFIGVAGVDWLGILIDDYEDQLQYEDAGQFSHRMSKFLIQQQGCNMIIALTHMRVPQDQKLPFEAPKLDLILGGHDHIIFKEFINEIPVLKSGDNFKSIGIIDVFKKETNPQAHFKGRNYDFNIVVQEIPVAQKSDEDMQLLKLVEQCMDEYNKNDCIVGYCDVDLDTRFSQVRTKETNYGNFLADLVRLYFNSDCCIINSGAIRNDALLKSGPITYSMISNIINDCLVVKEVPGKNLFQALEYGCSNLPNTYSGSFLLVSGIKFTYDYRKNPRIQSVQVAGKPLDQQKLYRVATKLYVSTGGDGFSMLRDCKYLIDAVSGIQTLALLLKFFHGADEELDFSSNQFSIQLKAKISHKQSIDLTDSANQKATPQNQPKQAPTLLKRQTSILSKLPSLQNLKLHRKASTRMCRIFNLSKQIVQKQGKKYFLISPHVENRIKSLYP